MMVTLAIPWAVTRRVKIEDTRPVRKRLQSQPLCPHCGTALRISAVNVSRCTRVGGGWRSIGVCQNDQCLYSELSLKSVTAWSRQ